MTEIHDSQPPSPDAVGSQMTPAHDGRPVILVVDDEADKLERGLALALDDAAELVVRHPSEVESEDVARAHLVLVDYLLNDWPERRGLPAVFRIRTGLALATVLREVADESSNGHLTAVALHTGHLRSVSGHIRPPHSHHVVARLNNLEWAFEKSDAARTRGAVQLARAAQRLEGDWPADASASEARLRDLLSLGDKVGWTERAWDHVRECQPPVHKLGGGRHGVLVLRWLLHQILPYPCFLSDVNWVAARLRISVDDLDRLLSSDCELARDLEGLKYTGLMAGFLGDRWWRAAMEDYAWELGGRFSGRPEQFEQRLAEKAGEELELVAPRDPVVCLDQDLQPVGTASPEEAVRLRPDYWPPFADAAWMRIDDVRNDPALGAMVEPLDDYRVEVDE